VFHEWNQGPCPSDLTIALDAPRQQSLLCIVACRKDLLKMCICLQCAYTWPWPDLKLTVYCFACRKALLLIMCMFAMCIYMALATPKNVMGALYGGLAAICTHTHTHTHSHTHTHKHTHTQTHTHTYKHTHTHTHTHTHIDTYTHTHVQTHTHTHTDTYTRNSHTHAHTCTYTQERGACIIRRG